MTGVYPALASAGCLRARKVRKTRDEEQRQLLGLTDGSAALASNELPKLKNWRNVRLEIREL